MAPRCALRGLVVASVGAVNATALLMVAPAPVLWLVVATLERRVSWIRAMTTAVRIGVLSVVVSLWWIVAVVIQGRRGAEVLAYSESLESVSFTSTSTEVWRGLGYWLTYISDPFAATTTAATDHLTSGRLILGGFILLVIAVLGVVLTRWRERRFAIALIVTGVVLGVGVHPLDDPSPLMSVLAGDGETGLALALRSSTRAVPMLMLGLALGAGAVGGCARVVPPRGAGSPCDRSPWPAWRCWRWSTCRRSSATASSTRRSIAIRTCRRPGSRPPPRSTSCPPATGSCRSPASSSARSDGATPSIRRSRG